MSSFGKHARATEIKILLTVVINLGEVSCGKKKESQASSGYYSATGIFRPVENISKNVPLLKSDGSFDEKR